MKLLRFIFLVFILFGKTSGYGQEPDDLVQQLNKSTSDTTKLRLLVLISDDCELDEIEHYTTQAITLADKLLKETNYNKKDILIQKATAINNLAFLNHTLSKSDRGVKCFVNLTNLH